MLYVRYPNGTVVTYNDGGYIVYGDEIVTMYNHEKEPRKWICSIPYASGGVIEAVKACKVEQSNTTITPEGYLEYVLEHLRDYAGYWNEQRLATLKQKLEKFNRQRKEWTD